MPATHLLKEAKAWICCRRGYGIRRDARPRIEQADLDRDIAAIKTKIGSSAFEVAYNSGQGMTMDELVALALGERKQA